MNFCTIIFLVSIFTYSVEIQSTPILHTDENNQLFLQKDDDLDDHGSLLEEEGLHEMDSDVIKKK